MNRLVCFKFNGNFQILARSSKIMYEAVSQYDLASYIQASRNFHVSIVRPKVKRTQRQELIIKTFLDHEDKNKENFLISVQHFMQKKRNLKGQVEFIYGALNMLQEYGLHKDIEVYKALMEIMPEEVMVPTNTFQAMFEPFPLQQNAGQAILVRMEKNLIIPDSEMQSIIRKRFGIRSKVFIKMARMLYWMPKFKYRSPWRLPEELPTDVYELALVAIKRIVSVDPASEIKTYQTNELEDSVDHTWVISGSSPAQKKLIEEHKKDSPIKVEGPFAIYLRNFMVNYFILRADPLPKPLKKSKREIDDILSMESWLDKRIEKEASVTKLRSVHEQDDGLILGVCATGTSSRDSVLSWIRFLHDDIPSLDGIPILFTQSSPVGSIMSEEELIKTKERQKEAVEEELRKRGRKTEKEEMET